jgi:imidazolonepropionase-like amidohydrolase
VGKLADLVILRANPLDDIRNTRKIQYVIKIGVLYDGADGTRAGEAFKIMYFNTN